MRRKIEKLLIAVVLLIIGLKANNTAGKAIDSNNITATASSVYISGGDGYIYGPQYTIDKSGLNRRGYHDIYALDMWMSNYDGGGKTCIIICVRSLWKHILSYLDPCRTIYGIMDKYIS